MDKIETGRWWRVLLSENLAEIGYHDVWGVKPMVDEAGRLAFGNLAGNLMALFAPGAWLGVYPVRGDEAGPEGEA